MEIRKAAVIGSGVMGGGIAAHIANSGVPVVLLDIVPKDAQNRNQLAEGAVAKMLKANPSPFAHPDNAKLVMCGNLEDNLRDLTDVDWIVEAVLERLDVKQGVYRTLEEVRKAGSVVSSNTSTLPIATLVEGMPQRFREDFCIAHFFNPPRFMRLLELVGGEETRSEALAAVQAFCDVRLGKGVVVAKDTPGFLANRIGVYWMMAGLLEALEIGLTVEEADAVMGRPFGIPSTGVFGLFDLIGIDLIPLIAKAMMDNLPQDDDFRRLYRWPDRVKRMVDEGYTGRKGKGGFYRVRKEEERKIKETVDLATGEYRAAQKTDLPRRDLKTLIAADDRTGRYAWTVMSRLFVYAASLVPEISDDLRSIDQAMTLGYAWEKGPFALMDEIGAADIAARLERERRAVPPLIATAAARGGFYAVGNGHRRFLTLSGDYAPIVRPEGVLRLADIKDAKKSVLSNASASLWDLGDGVLCLEQTAKMHTLDEQVFALMHEAIGIVKAGHQGLVIGHDGDLFSAGANLNRFAERARKGEWEEISAFIKLGQATFAALKFAPFPVVTALHGRALGGGCELNLQADAIQAHLEAYSGLVEKNVGFIPGWGGTVEMLLRWRDPAKVLGLLMGAKVSSSAHELIDIGILREPGRITMNRDRLLADAKHLCLTLAKGYAAPKLAMLNLPGGAGRDALLAAAPSASGHDEAIRQVLATVLSGGTGQAGSMDELELRALEHDGFMELVKTPAALERMEKIVAR